MTVNKLSLRCHWHILKTRIDPVRTGGSSQLAERYWCARAHRFLFGNCVVYCMHTCIWLGFCICNTIVDVLRYACVSARYVEKILPKRYASLIQIAQDLYLVRNPRERRFALPKKTSSSDEASGSSGFKIIYTTSCIVKVWTFCKCSALILFPLHWQVCSPTSSTNLPSDSASPVESVGAGSSCPEPAPLQTLPACPSSMMFPETMPFDSFNVEKAVAGTMNFDQHQGMFEMRETLPACDFLPFPAYPCDPTSFSAWQQVPQGDSQFIPDSDLLDGLALGLAPSFQPEPQLQPVEICSDDDVMEEAPYALPVQPVGLDLGQAWFLKH